MKKRFVKNNSVFAPWKEDTKQLLDNAFLFDFEQWKIKKQIKNEQDVSLILRNNLVQKIDIADHKFWRCDQRHFY